jgi:hypothetical protein
MLEGYALALASVNPAMMTAFFREPALGALENPQFKRVYT